MNKPNTSNGRPKIELAKSARHLYATYTGLPANDNLEPGWRAVADFASRAFDRPGGQFSVADLAKEFCTEFAKAENILTFSWENVTQKFAWELVVRHLLNAIQSDAKVPLADLEKSVMEWASASREA
jgi:hypothetical protein